VKIAVASDLHFEFHRDGGLALLGKLAEADVLVCAGDLSSARCLAESLDLCCSRYPHVVFVAGNHEFYGSSIPAVREILRDASKRHLGRLHVLDNSTCEIDGIRFVGTTMWTRHTPGIHKYQRLLNDFTLIKDADPLVYEENVRALAFLEAEVSSSDVVVTHHLPVEGSVHPKYKGSPLNCFFLCDVEPLIRKRQPRLWVHGHTHESVDLKIGVTRVLCNPFGYVAHEENPSFDSDLTVGL
jgi:Icc-related predicted phosphoesterase